jgi:hypothetical protein
MSVVHECLEELQDALEVMAPRKEGMLDFLRLNIKPETRDEVDRQQKFYSDQMLLVQNAIAALQTLTNAKYPDLPKEPVSQAVYDDLATQINTVSRAIEQFEAPAEATNAKISSSDPVLK